MDTKSLSFGYRLNASPFTHQSFDGEKRKKKRKRKSDHPHVFFVVVVDSKRGEPNVRGGHPRSSEWNETRAF